MQLKGQGVMTKHLQIPKFPKDMAKAKARTRAAVSGESLEYAGNAAEVTTIKMIVH